MYNQIKKMHAEGSTFSQIASFLGLDRRTVKKYYRMEINCMTAFLAEKRSAVSCCPPMKDP
ncbi:helix-turn-helix domain-containing protein [Arcticibacter sp. MXS-1]|uniref:helix-turn-helix domain-containing protein n=1 Tax=Arcticibacter sp. MXS-1 TaxID=3341726 RepID=UPI0035A93AD1